ncbi:MAG: AMP-binding protein [Candidatus Solibacter sp.]
MTLGQIFHATALRNAHKAAIHFCGESITYSELDRRARELAQTLLAQGLHPGDRVGLHSTNSVEAVTVLLACFYSGLICVPINVRLKAHEIAYILGHSQPRVCFSHPNLAPLTSDAVKETALTIPVHSALPAAESPGAPLPELRPETLAAILYTSGTTARPKGVTHSHASLIGTAATMWPTGIAEGSTMIVAVPLMHASGLTASVVPGLLAGATLAMLPVFDPGVMLDHIERYRCTWGLGLPAMMLAAANEQERQPRDVSSLRAWVAGGDAVPIALQSRFQSLFGIPLLEAIAMTESLIIAWNRPGAIRPGSVGTASDGVELRVLSLTGAPLPDGETGELAVRGPANFIAYWNDPAATANALQDGWLLTGDLARRDTDGYIWFAGRRKEIIIRAGSNISPQEVEEALYGHPAILEVGVIGMPHPVYTEEVVACVSLREGRAAGAAELRDFARQRLADYKVPERFVFLPALPKGLTGKVQRRALKDLAR